MTKLPGDSREQQKAEIWLLDSLSRHLGVTLTKKRFSLDEGGWIELDGFCESPLVLCEAFAHIGPPKGGQKHKVMADAFKLLFVNALVKGDGKRILLFADREAAARFQGKSWMAQCLNKHNIIVEIIEPSLERKTELLKAQKRQYR